MPYALYGSQVDGVDGELPREIEAATAATEQSIKQRIDECLGELGAANLRVFLRSQANQVKAC